MNRDEPQPRWPIDPLLGDDLSGRGPNAQHPDAHRPGRVIRVNAAAIADAVSGVIEHASIVLRRREKGFTVLAAAPAREIEAMGLPEQTPELTLHDRILIPALVNAHTHLDLTHLGPRQHEPGEGFVGWVEMVRAGRATDEEEIIDSVRLGVARSIAGGSAAVGDIAGAPAGRLTDAPALALAASPLIGVSCLEFFGIGRSAAPTIKRLNDYLHDRFPHAREELRGSGVTLGLQPHAPNTVDLGVYRWAAGAAAARGIPLSTHLAETPEEREFIADGAGPQRDMLERFMVWDDSVLDHIGHGKHPIEHLAPLLGEHPMLLAHVNDAGDREIDLLAATASSVSYCPRASRYFGAEMHFGPHRYRDMLAAGINVCLGTDSIINLDTPGRISVLDEMRLLHSRDATDAGTLLAMGTVAGARALGLEERAFTIAPGSTPWGILAIAIGPGACDPWDGAMRGNDAPLWLFLREK